MQNKQTLRTFNLCFMHIGYEAVSSSDSLLVKKHQLQYSFDRN